MGGSLPVWVPWQPGGLRMETPWVGGAESGDPLGGLSLGTPWVGGG